MRIQRPDGTWAASSVWNSLDIGARGLRSMRFSDSAFRRPITELTQTECLLLEARRKGHRTSGIRKPNQRRFLGVGPPRLGCARQFAASGQILLMDEPALRGSRYTSVREAS